MKGRWTLLAGMVLVGAVGCSSPEAVRTRGQGPGADVGNRPQVVKMHEGSDPYWRTPVEVPGQPAIVEAARHAKRLATEWP